MEGPIASLKNLLYVRSDNTTVTIPSDEAEFTSSVITPAKVYKALRNAPYNPVVCTVINWITDQATICPLLIMSVQEDGDMSVEPSHDILSLLRRPSNHISGRELLTLAIWDLLIYGQAFWHKERQRDGTVKTLMPLQARRVRVRGSSDELVTHYEYYHRFSFNYDGRIDDYQHFATKPVEYKAEEVVHIRLEPDPIDPKNGLSPLRSVAKELLIDDETEDFTSNVLINQGSPGGLLVPPDDVVLPEDVAKATREYVKGEFKGNKRGEIGVLRAAMRWLDTQLSPRNIELRSIQNTSEERICGVLGVHPVVVGLGAGNSQSRVGAATKEFERAAWENRIIPLQETIIEQISRQLMPDFVPLDDIDMWKLGWDRAGIMALQPDKLKEAQRWSISVAGGIAQRGEARRALELDADDVDKVYIMHHSSVLVPADAAEIPPPPDTSNGHGHEGDEPEEEAPSEDEAEELDLDIGRTKDLLRVYRLKAELDDDQRSLLVSQTEEAERLETEMSEALDESFKELGDMAVDAFWRVNVFSSFQSIGSVREKLEPDEGEILRLVDMIDNAMLINDFVDHTLDPVYKAHYLRTLSSTAEGISQAINVGVNLPDDAARKVIAQGGTRLAMLDVSEDTRRALYRALHQGRSLGEGPVQLAARIQDQVPAGRYTDPAYRSRLIARTETKYAQNVSTLESYKAADTITRVRVIDAQSPRPDAECLALDGQEMSFREAEQIGALEHPNCTRSFSPIVDRNAPSPAVPTPPTTGPASSGFTRSSFDQHTIEYDDFDRVPGYVPKDKTDELAIYTSSGFDSINRNLREGLELEDWQKDVLRGLNREYKPLDQDRVLFRGLDTWGGPGPPGRARDPDFSEGSVIDLVTPTSVSADVRVAASFAEGDVIFELHVAKGTKAIITNPGEREFFFSPGSRMRVVKVYDDVTLPYESFYPGAEKASKYVVAVLE